MRSRSGSTSFRTSRLEGGVREPSAGYTRLAYARPRWPAHCRDLQQVDYGLPDGKEDAGWMLSVVGKGHKLRQVPVPARLVEELQNELDRNGLEAAVRHESNRDVAILARFEGGVATPCSASRLANGIKEVLERCAETMDIEDAKQLRKASTHWFRHTRGSHALNGRPGEKGVPIHVVQNN